MKEIVQLNRFMLYDLTFAALFAPFGQSLRSISLTYN